MKKKLLLFAVFSVFAVIALVSSQAHAVTFATGDVFAAIGNGQIAHYDSSGTFIENLNTGLGGLTTGMAFDSSGHLYVTNFSVGSVSEFDNDGNLVGTFGSGYSGAPESILFDASGNAYVGAVDGDNDIRKFDATGTPLDQYNVATDDRGSDWIDLASDQTTMFYTSEGKRVLRYDVGTDTQLADFNAALLPGSHAYALRILADGGVLVADTESIVRLDSSGNLIQTYDVAGENTWFALNLDPDGTSFWSGNFGTGMAYKFDIATGTQLLSINTGSSALYGLTVYGEITQGGGGAPVPEPATMLLLGSGLIGMFGFKKKKKDIS